MTSVCNKHVSLFPQPDDYEDQLVDIHKAKAGLSPAQAENEFLEVAQKLPRYGMHLFSAQVANTQLHHLHNYT